ncbi:hypothetical protein GGD70_002672 [Paraburkholderia fungorum]|nr:hypothetical protein [Paraburkholderia fungorum]
MAYSPPLLPVSDTAVTILMAGYTGSVCVFETLHA